MHTGGASGCSLYIIRVGRKSSVTRGLVTNSAAGDGALLAEELDGPAEGGHVVEDTVAGEQLATVGGDQETRNGGG